MSKFPGVKNVIFKKRGKNYNYIQEIADGICIKCKGDNVECLEDNNKHVCIDCKFTMWDVSDESYVSMYDGLSRVQCLRCSHLVEGAGIFSTGMPLKYHNPRPGELLKNIWIECGNCGWNQYS